MDKEKFNAYLADIHRCADEINIVVAALKDFNVKHLAKRLEESRETIVNHLVNLSIDFHEEEDDESPLLRR